MTLIIATKKSMYSDRRMSSGNKVIGSIKKQFEVMHQGKKIALLGISGYVFYLQTVKLVIGDIERSEPVTYLLKLRKAIIDKCEALSMGEVKQGSGVLAITCTFILCDGKKVYEMDCNGLVLESEEGMIGSGSAIAKYIATWTSNKEIFKKVNAEMPSDVSKEYDIGYL